MTNMYLTKESKKKLKASSKFTNAGTLDKIFETASYVVSDNNSIYNQVKNF